MIGGRGVLIRGRSGSGKSSLLLALLESGPGAMLVADDRVALSAERNRLRATVPAAIAGQMEVRGLGIVRRPHVSSAFVDLVIDLLPLEECPRLPTAAERTVVLEGVALPRVFVSIGAADAAVRVRAALAALYGKEVQKPLALQKRMVKMCRLLAWGARSFEVVVLPVEEGR
jgi:serine kinase of HPr protein (carbohydrate metabolism regulator)